MKTTRILSLVACLYALLAASCEEPQERSDLTSRTQAILGDAQAKPSIRIVDVGPQALGLGLNAGGIRIGAQATHGRLYSTLDCSDCGWTNELGKPRLPAIRRFVEVPSGAELAVVFEASGKQFASLEELGARHLIYPVQRPVEKRPGARERTPFEIDEQTYAADELYPRESFQISGPFHIRGRRLFLVEYYPVRYNPLRGTIETAADARLNLSFLGGAGTVPAETSPAFDEWFSANVLNYRTPVSRDISTAKYAEGILVIVGNDYASDADLLAYLETRRNEGHQVEMVPMADIGSSDDDVRAYVIHQYQAWADPALSHVVIFGDDDDVPSYPGDGATDNFYAAIDPDNYTSDMLAPDLSVSRVSVNSSTELKTYLIRADNYLFARFATDESWIKKIAWLASCDNASIAEGSHEYVADTYTESLGFTGIIPNNPEPGGDRLYCGNGDSSQTDIRTAINDGRLVVNMSGHGSATSWGDPSFGSLSGIDPPDAAPFVLSFACETGTFDYGGGDCWGEEWLAHSHGAIMFYGASNSSYWGEDDIMEKRLWDGVFADGITWLGPIILNAKMELLEHYGAGSSIRYYFEIFNALGDGTIDFFTDLPFDAVVDYQTEIPLGVDAIDFAVSKDGSALEGALVCVRGGAVQQVGLTDASGQVTLVLDPLPNEVGNLKVTASAHNMRRHEGEILVIPSDVPYMMHVSHEITSDGSAPIAPNPGRHVVMPITVHNIGTQAGSGVAGTLSSDNPGITITQAQAVFPDVQPDAQARSSTHAEYDIGSGITDGSVIPFRLAWSTTEGSSGTLRFNVTVERPLLLYVSHTVSDADGECDLDGVADLNELATFSVTIINQGSGSAGQVMLGLTAPNCLISDPADIGQVAPGAQATGVFTVVPQEGIACPANDVQFLVEAQSPELPVPDLSSFTEVLNADVSGDAFSDDMEGIEPNGWSHDADAGGDDWGYVTSSCNSPTHAWFASDLDNIKDSSLYTPATTIGDTSQLTFWQRYDFEANYDGAVIEISTNGGSSYSDLGDYITQGGYTHTLSTQSQSPIGGREAWSGTQDWHEVVVDLSAFGPASVIIRFRLTCDRAVNQQGWWIDDAALDAQTVVCQEQDCIPPNLAPVADAGPDQQVDSRDMVALDGSASYDPEGDPITFSWTQTSGAPVTLSDPLVAGPTFTAPHMEGLVNYVFELTVSDPENSDTDNVTIAVWGGCDDGNSCTDDTFSDGLCHHVDKTCGEGESCCDDGDRCTVTDICQAGVCIGTVPITCQPLDECHLAGECDPATGSCSNPNAPDGAECSEGTCKNGKCSSGATGCGCAHGQTPDTGAMLLLLVLGLAFRRSRSR